MPHRLTPSAGHYFSEELYCHGCGTSWQEHQDAPADCATPHKKPRTDITVCSQGHPRIREHGFYKENEHGMLIWNCSTCDRRRRYQNTCSRGHPRTAEFGRYERKTKTKGKAWRCRACALMVRRQLSARRAQEAIEKAKPPVRINRCRSGKHMLIGANLVLSKSKGRTRRECRACRTIRRRELWKERYNDPTSGYRDAELKRGAQRRAKRRLEKADSKAEGGNDV